MPNNDPHLDDLFRYLEEEQTAEERQHFEAHLETCEPCQEAINQVRAYRAALRNAGPENEPDEQWAHVEDAVVADVLAGARGAGAPRRLLMATAVVGALAAAAAAALVLFGDRATPADSGRGGQAAIVGPGMRVVAVSGDVDVQDDSGRLRRVAPGELLGPGARLALASDAELRLELESRGLQAHVKGPARLLVNAVRPELARLDLQQGDVVLRVEKDQRPPAVEVGTPGGLVTVTGTVFGVQHGQDSGTVVAVLRGEVLVAPTADLDVLVRTGWRLSLHGRRLERIEADEWSRLAQRVGLQGAAPPVDDRPQQERRTGAGKGDAPALEPGAPAGESAGASEQAAPPTETATDEPVERPGQRERDLEQFLEQGEKYKGELER